MSQRIVFTSDLPKYGFSYSLPHLHKLIKAGKFPRPVKGFGKENAWPEEVIVAAVEERISAASEKKAA